MSKNVKPGGLGSLKGLGALAGNTNQTGRDKDRQPKTKLQQQNTDQAAKQASTTKAVTKQQPTSKKKFAMPTEFIGMVVRKANTNVQGIAGLVVCYKHTDEQTGRVNKKYYSIDGLRPNVEVTLGSIVEASLIQKEVRTSNNRTKKEWRVIIENTVTYRPVHQQILDQLFIQSKDVFFYDWSKVQTIIFEPTDVELFGNDELDGEISEELLSRLPSTIAQITHRGIYFHKTRKNNTATDTNATTNETTNEGTTEHASTQERVAA